MITSRFGRARRDRGRRRAEKLGIDPERLPPGQSPTLKFPVMTYAGVPAPPARWTLTVEPLDAEHGGPVRLLVPALYGWKSAKWLERLELLAEDRPGLWERNGYHNDADPWREQRHSRGS